MAEKSLYQIYMKDGMYQSNLRGHSLYLKFIRWLGFFPFYIFHKLGLTANAASFVGFLIELLGVGLFLTSHYFLAALMIFIGVVFDFFDGVLARTRNEVGTLNTALLCSLHHFFTPTLVLAAGFINYYFLTKDVDVLLLALVVGVASAMTFQLIIIRGRALFKYYPGFANKQEEVLVNRRHSIIFRTEQLLERIIDHGYAMILVYAVNPLVFIGLFSILIPARLLSVFTYFYFTNRKLEKQLVKYKKEHTKGEGGRKLYNI